MKWFLLIMMFFVSVALKTFIEKLYLLEENVFVMQERIVVLEQKIEEQKTIISGMSPDSLFNREWLLFKLALIKVESNFDEKAVNKTNGDGGLFQILPVGKSGFLEESNRLLGYVEFTDSCRFDPERSNEMMEIVNGHHNPAKDINVAISLHNPRAGSWYRDRVLKEYEFLKQIASQK